MTIPPPQAAEEGALIGWALFSALGDLLVAKKIITDTELRGVYENAADRLDRVPQLAGPRAAQFVRSALAGRK